MNKTIMVLNLKQVLKKYLIPLLVYGLLVCGLALVPSQQCNASGNTYYVAKTGLDSNDGSSARPWLTIQHAANTVAAGDTVYVKNGTYYEHVLISARSGTAGNPITFKAYPGDAPVIDGSNLSVPVDTIGIVEINANYIDFSGFEIANSPSDLKFHGVLLDSGIQHINLANLKIHDIAHCGIASREASYIVIDNCEIYNTNILLADETISLISNNNVEIKNCRIHDINKAAIDCKGSRGTGSCNNISIHDNDISGHGIYIDCQGMDQSGFSIYRNKIHDCDNGIAFASEIQSATLSGVDIFNNIFYNNLTGIVVWQYSFPKTIRIINNTLYMNDRGIVWGDTAAQYQVNCVTTNNIIVSSSTSILLRYDYYAQGGVTVNNNLFYDTNGNYNVSTFGTNYVKANPQLNNPPTDFSIRSTSPAKDAGSSVNAPQVDYTGTIRPQGASYDIGAFEFINTVVYTDWDVNMDGVTNILDHILIGQHFNETGIGRWIRADVNGDGVINVLDNILVGQHSS